MNDRKAESKNMVIGVRPVMEAIDAGHELDKVLVQKGLRGELFHQLQTLLRDRGIPFQQVPEEKLRRLTRSTHQGVIAFISPISFASLDHIVTEAFQKGRNLNLLMLDGVTDVRNFGAICRTAECMGVDAVIIPEKGSAQINEDAVKTSAGALFRIPVCRVRSLTSTARELQNSGVRIHACTEKGKMNVASGDMTVPSCIIMGSEEHGISNELIRLADNLVKIPMAGKTGSLNVSVAAAMILYELRRQRTSLSQD